MVGYILKEGVARVRDGAFTQMTIPGLDGVIAVFPDETPLEVMQVLTAWRQRYSQNDEVQLSLG